MWATKTCQWSGSDEPHLQSGNTCDILECNCSLVLSVSWHMILHTSSALRYQCSVCRLSYKALFHVGTQQERVDQPRFDQLLVVGCLDAVWTPYCEPPQGSLETHTHISVYMCTGTQTYASSHIKITLHSCVQKHTLKSYKYTCNHTHRSLCRQKK